MQEFTQNSDYKKWLLRFSFRIQIPTFRISSEFAIFRQLNSSFYLTIFAKNTKAGSKETKKTFWKNDSRINKVIKRPKVIMKLLRESPWSENSIFVPKSWIIFAILNHWKSNSNSLTRLTWLIHTSFLPSKWNLYPKIQFLA